MRFKFDLFSLMNDLSPATKESKPLSILIIGAGIGGLTLANLLRQIHPTITVRLFERDAAVHARTQGGTLGLKKPGGLDALRRLGMDEAIQVTFSFCCGTLIIEDL